MSACVNNIVCIFLLSDVSSLDSLGTNLSLVGSFDVMRIDIVVSEGCEKKLKTNTRRKGNGKFSLTMPEETPAFLCEKVGVELEVLKMTDGLLEDAKQNVPYLSRGQLKKNIQTVVNFSLNIRYISQQVCQKFLFTKSFAVFAVDFNQCTTMCSRSICRYCAYCIR